MNEMASSLLVPEIGSESGGNLSEESLAVGFGLMLKDEFNDNLQESLIFHGETNLLMGNGDLLIGWTHFGQLVQTTVEKSFEFFRVFRDLSVGVVVLLLHIPLNIISDLQKRVNL